jgi:hypothetical protein
MSTIVVSPQGAETVGITEVNRGAVFVTYTLKVAKPDNNKPSVKLTSI